MLCSQFVREKLAENISKVLQSIYFLLKRAIGVTSACKTERGKQIAQATPMRLIMSALFRKTEKKAL